MPTIWSFFPVCAKGVWLTPVWSADNTLFFFFGGEKTNVTLEYLNDSGFMNLKSWLCGTSNPKHLLKPRKCFSSLFSDVWFLLSLLAGCNVRASVLALQLVSKACCCSVPCSSCSLCCGACSTSFFPDGSKLSQGWWEEG